MSVESILKQIAVETIGDVGSPDIVFPEIDTWDSMNHMRFIMLIEERFGVVLDGDDIVEMLSLGETERILKKYGVF